LITLGLAAATVRDFKFEAGKITTCEGLPHRFEKLLATRRAVSGAVAAQPASAER
jgi:hypothetical protein